MNIMQTEKWAKLYKRGFFLMLFLVFGSLTIINYLYLSYKSKISAKDNGCVQLVNVLSASHKHNGLQFPIKKAYSVVNKDSMNTIFKEKSIIVLLSDAGCNPCQVSELKKIDTLYLRYSKSVSFFAIYNGISKTEPLLLRKVSKAKFPFYETKYDEFSSFVEIKRYPMILLVKDQTVLYNYFPLSDNPNYSKWALEIMEKLISN